MGSETAYFTVAELSAVASGSQWMRSWWRLPSDEFLDLTFLSLESNIAAVGIFVELYTGGQDYTVATPYDFAEDETVTSAVPFRPDEWICIETHIDYDGERIEFFVNSDNAMTIQAPIPEALAYARLGAVYRDPDEPATYDIYIDDIVVSNTRVGCD